MNGGVPGGGSSAIVGERVLFVRKSVIARESLLKIAASLAFATSGLRTNLLLQELALETPIRFSPRNHRNRGNDENPRESGVQSPRAPKIFCKDFEDRMSENLLSIVGESSRGNTIRGNRTICL